MSVSARPFHSVWSSLRSRVTPGRSWTTASRDSVRRLTSEDLPTLGYPTTATFMARPEASGGARRRIDRRRARLTPVRVRPSPSARRQRRVGPRAGAVARAGVGLVAPQRLHGEGRALVALDVAHGPRYRGDRGLLGQAGDDQRLAHPRALVAVLVGVERVIPAAVVGLRGGPAAHDVLRSGIGDRLLDLVPEDDAEAVQLARGAAIHGVLAAHVGAAGVDGERVRHVRVGDARRDAVVDPALEVGQR